MSTTQKSHWKNALYKYFIKKNHSLTNQLKIDSEWVSNVRVMHLLLHHIQQYVRILLHDVDHRVGTAWTFCHQVVQFLHCVRLIHIYAAVVLLEFLEDAVLEDLVGSDHGHFHLVHPFHLRFVAVFAFFVQSFVQAHHFLSSVGQLLDQIVTQLVRCWKRKFISIWAYVFVSEEILRVDSWQTFISYWLRRCFSLLKIYLFPLEFVISNDKQQKLTIKLVV